MKHCPYCGNALDDNMKFCGKCGAQQPEAPSASGPIPKAEGEEANSIPWPDEAYQRSQMNSSSNRTQFGTKRGIAACIIFSIITCGIYQLYWIYKLNEELNQMAGERDYTNGGLVILLTLVTCGIYGFYWYYKMGKLVEKISGKGDSSTLYLVLGILGLGFIDCCLMQDAINSAINSDF